MSLPEAVSASQAVPPQDPLPGVIEHASVNLLAGASGVGKTCLTSWLLTRFRDNLPIFGHQPNPIPKIAYLCADRGWSSTRQWFVRAGFPDVSHYSLTDDLSFEPGRLEQKRQLVPVLRESLAKLNPLPPGSLVVVDPIALFMGGNLNDYQSCAVSLVRIRRICLELQITILGLCHASKQKNDRKEQYKRLQDRIMGSAAQHGYGDTQMYLASPEETGEKFYTFLWHPHLSEPKTFKLGRDQATGLFIPYEEEEDVTGNTPPLSVEDQINTNPHILAIHELITDVDPGTATADILTNAQATHQISRSSAFRALNLLAQAGWVQSIGRGRWRRLLPLQISRAD